MCMFVTSSSFGPIASLADDVGPRDRNTKGRQGRITLSCQTLIWFLRTLRPLNWHNVGFIESYQYQCIMCSMDEVKGEIGGFFANGRRISF